MTKRAHIELGDGINLLPDELLVGILCFLSLKEAAATSILSRRWRYLWTYTNKLDFDGSYFFWRLGSRLELFQHFGPNFLKELMSVSSNFEESWNYITWVNNILGVHKGSSIEEFRVDFFLYEAHKDYIERWLRFASSKNVKRLELKLRWTLFALGGEGREEYTFPCELFINFKHLRTMRLSSVNVSGEGIEFLLGSSPLLEELSLYHSKKLMALKIIGSSLALKRLEIVDCYLASIEIRDVNLEFFMYHGTLLNQFVLKNVPLVEMHLGGQIITCMKDLLLMFSSYLPQLEKLTIDVFDMGVFCHEEGRMLHNKVKMSNLHQLIFKYYGVCPFMPQMIYFIRAAPFLQNFVFEVYGDCRKKRSICAVNNLPKELKLYKYPHLKQIEFIGYCGKWHELDLAVHFLENGSALKQFNIDLRKRDNPQAFHNCFWPNSVNGWLPVGYPYSEEHKINAFKARVKEKLIRRLPSTIQNLQLNII